MKTTRILALAAALAAGISAPAWADWDNIGTVHFDYGVDSSSAYTAFAGPVDGLQLTARGGDVDCRYVRATFANGNVRNIFSGHLDRATPRYVDMPGDVRRIRRLDFLCRTYRGTGANVQIAANLSRYRDEWRRDPYWARTWGGGIGIGGGGVGIHVGGGGISLGVWDNPDRWVLLGAESFEGGMDHESRFADWGGRNVTEIALRPVDGDARCANVVVTFGNGNRSRLDVNAGDRMEEGHFYRLDLPGTVRNIQRIDLDCRAAGQYAVRIQIYANK